MPVGKDSGSDGLSRRTLREIERELEVFLDIPVNVARCPFQQFGVYDANEDHAGDIVAEKWVFDADELRQKIAALFNKAS